MCIVDKVFIPLWHQPRTKNAHFDCLWAEINTSPAIDKATLDFVGKDKAALGCKVNDLLRPELRQLISERLIGSGSVDESV